jgi:hypothetical protein
MTRYCIACGSALADRARFCGECGAAVVSATGPQQQVEPQPAVDMPLAHEDVDAAPLPSSIDTTQYDPNETAYAEPAEEHADWSEPLSEEALPRGPNWMLIGGGIAILLLLLLFYLFFIRDVAGENPARAAPKAAESQKTEEVETKQLFAISDANIRDRPTAQGSTIVGKLVRGAAATGTVINGEDETSEWLELEDGKGFIGLVNLSETKPPVIAKALGDKSWTTDKPLEIWSQPDPSATLIDRVPAGSVLTLFGLTSNDYIEIKLRKGGVGYIAGGAKLLETVVPTSKPITISFNPATCNFGGEMEVLFAKLAAQIEAKRLAVAKAKYPSEEAREAAIQKYESATELRSDFIKVNRSYNGLTVTAIGQHYESQSVYFSDPPEKVTAAFRAAGHKIGKDGMFPPTDLLSSVGASSSDAGAYGKSELSCGV